MAAKSTILLIYETLAAAGGVNRSLPQPLGSSRTVQGLASRAANVAVTGAAAVYGINDNETSNGGLGYQAYYGDGSSNEGWLTISQGVLFNYIWQANYNNIQSSCGQFGVGNFSDDEMNDLHNGLEH